MWKVKDTGNDAENGYSYFRIIPEGVLLTWQSFLDYVNLTPEKTNTHQTTSNTKPQQTKNHKQTTKTTNN